VRTREQGRGVAVTAVRLLIEWAARSTDLARIEALIPVDNTASLRVAERAGAVRERLVPGLLAIHGVWHDGWVLSFTLPRTTWVC
jgi:RimJ/RimL family protein N-acetyltransferase